MGETSQILYQRILHQTYNDSTIHDHIQSCPQHLEASSDSVKRKTLNNDQKRQFFVHQIKILESCVLNEQEMCSSGPHKYEKTYS